MCWVSGSLNSTAATAIIFPFWTFLPFQLQFNSQHSKPVSLNHFKCYFDNPPPCYCVLCYSMPEMVEATPRISYPEFWRENVCLPHSIRCSFARIRNYSEMPPVNLTQLFGHPSSNHKGSRYAQSRGGYSGMTQTEEIPVHGTIQFNPSFDEVAVAEAIERLPN